jgi:hypothetical protein
MMGRKAARNMYSRNTNKTGIQCVCWFYSLGICHDARSYDPKMECVVLDWIGLPEFRALARTVIIQFGYWLSNCWLPTKKWLFSNQLLKLFYTQHLGSAFLRNLVYTYRHTWRCIPEESNRFPARSQNCETPLLPSSCLPICPVALNDSAPTYKIFIKFDIWVFSKIYREVLMFFWPF